AVAPPHEVLLTEPVAEAAETAEVKVSPIGSRRLDGIDQPVELWRIVRDEDIAGAIRDPVCGMTVGDDAAAHLVYGGIDYSFCSADCLRRFIEDPERYTTPPRE